MLPSPHGAFWKSAEVVRKDTWYSWKLFKAKAALENYDMWWLTSLLRTAKTDRERETKRKTEKDRDRVLTYVSATVARSSVLSSSASVTCSLRTVYNTRRQTHNWLPHTTHVTQQSKTNYVTTSQTVCNAHIAQSTVYSREMHRYSFCPHPHHIPIHL